MNISGLSSFVIIMVLDGGAGCTTGGRFDRSSLKFLADEDLRLDFGVSIGDDEVGGGSVRDILNEL